MFNIRGANYGKKIEYVSYNFEITNDFRLVCPDLYGNKSFGEVDFSEWEVSLITFAKWFVITLMKKDND